MSSPMVPTAAEILVEAEEFDDFGGWVLDSQFELQMGSPYLLAHGLGRPVGDARTTIAVAEAGSYHVWVRAKDWVPAHHPGRFALSIGGTPLEPEFGATGQDWSWQHGGRVRLAAGVVELVLHDLTGFDGRCDAIYLTTGDTVPPDGADDAARSWRRRLRGLPDMPVDGGSFDVVVVGGGVSGSVAALAAARLGSRVALVQDRPYLGGNASVEIGLSPRGGSGHLVDELAGRLPDGDLLAATLLNAEPTATVLAEHTVYGVEMDGASVVSIDARDARSGREIRLRGPVFIDCSGKAVLAVLAGVETMFGQEARSDYGEGLAPEVADDMHHGNTVFFRTRMADGPVAFPDASWALGVAKDFANLSGQLQKTGIENGPGPAAGPHKEPPPSVRRRMRFPATHFWEFGQWLDPYTEGERIRDHLLCAIYGTFHNVKTLEPDTYANLVLDHVAHVPAQGEYRRYRGDHVLTENDIREHRQFPDAVVENDGAFCLHYPGDEKYDFRLKDWKWDVRDEKPFEIPFRCLYATDLSNVLMAGKHISATHIAAANTKHMGNGGHHAVAAAVAAVLCNRYRTTPRGVYENHLAELQEMTATITGKRPGLVER